MFVVVVVVVALLLLLLLLVFDGIDWCVGISLCSAATRCKDWKTSFIRLLLRRQQYLLLHRTHLVQRPRAEEASPFGMDGISAALHSWADGCGSPVLLRVMFESGLKICPPLPP